MTRWGEWGGYEGSCTPERCDYQILLQDAVSSEQIHFWSTGGALPAPHRCCQWFHKPFRALGGRQALIYAGIKVRNGIIWTKAYDVVTGLKPRIYEGEKEYGDDLIGLADGVTRFWENESWLSMMPQRNYLVHHPEYTAEIAGICSGCRAVNAHFTPLADPVVVWQLLDFNLDCITRWFECKTPVEIMPGTVRLYEQDKAAPQRPDAPKDRCGLPLEVLGRDYKYVAIAEVVSARTIQEPDGSYRWFRFRPIVSLKNHAVPQVPTIGKDDYVEPLEAHLAGGGPVVDLKPGTRFILLFESPFDEHDTVTIGADKCGFVSYSDQNLTAIQRGIQRDVFSDAQ
jgi:hypothetical protein